MNTPLNDTAHTPTPWKADRIHGKPTFNIRAGQISVAHVYEHIGSNVLYDRAGEGEANAAFIVEACNSFESLKAEVERLRAGLLRIGNVKVMKIDAIRDLALSLVSESTK